MTRLMMLGNLKVLKDSTCSNDGIGYVLDSETFERGGLKVI